MQDGANDTSTDNSVVLETVDPAMVVDGDELDDVGGVESAHAEDETKPTALKNHDDPAVGEVSEDGDRDGGEGDGGHAQVGEKAERGAHVRVHL